MVRKRRDRREGKIGRMKSTVYPNFLCSKFLFFSRKAIPKRLEKGRGGIGREVV